MNYRAKHGYKISNYKILGEKNANFHDLRLGTVPYNTKKISKQATNEKINLTSSILNTFTLQRTLPRKGKGPQNERKYMQIIYI